MRISIAMATYNGAPYIREQLQSFIDQTRQPDELIITDDGSCDETESIIREFAKISPFAVTFQRNPRKLGYCGNFNAALMLTDGDLVFLSDQDDVWFPEKIEHMVGVAERNPQAFLLMNDAALTDGALREVGLSKLGQIKSAGLSMENFVMGCCCAIRREFLNICMPIPVGLKGHDNWLVRISDAFKGRVVDPAILQYYRRHGSNESQFIANSTKKVTRIQKSLYLFRLLMQRKAITNLSEQLEQGKIFREGISNILTTAPDQYRETLRLLQCDYQKRIELTEQRLAIVQKSFFPRIVSASTMLLYGGYRNANGFRSMARDIIG